MNEEDDDLDDALTAETDRARDALIDTIQAAKAAAMRRVIRYGAMALSGVVLWYSGKLVVGWVSRSRR